jgi:beta-lactamase class A
MKKYILAAVVFISASCKAQDKSSLQAEISKIAAALDGKVGISIVNLKTKERIVVNENQRFPMQSVYKFPLAMAVFEQIDNGKFGLEQKMKMSKADLLPNTHSPLRDKYPEGKADISLKEILENTVSLSDNNGCDYLFRLIGGTKVADAYVKKLPIKEINIVGTEAEMHTDNKMQYKNYATPQAMTELLIRFYSRDVLSEKSTAALWKMLVETSTAPNRIKGNLAKGTVLGHKSGWSGGDDKGFTEAINDAGIMILPDGTAVAITVFVSDTRIKSVETDKFVAKISRMAYDYFLRE